MRSVLQLDSISVTKERDAMDRDLKDLGVFINISSHVELRSSSCVSNCI